MGLRVRAPGGSLTYRGRRAIPKLLRRGKKDGGCYAEVNDVGHAFARVADRIFVTSGGGARNYQPLFYELIMYGGRNGMTM